MASVVQLVKDLFGKEDINWGDSDSTFTRETATGGSASIHYVDDKIIPANALGGYIGDHLHVQNTDSGTTSTTFYVGTDGSKIILSNAGLTANRTFTFPDGSNQALVGATDLLSTANGKGASKVGVEDAGGLTTNTNVESCLAEIYADIASLQITNQDRGYARGFMLAYVDSDTISIGGGFWDHRGTSNQKVYTESAVTFDLGPGGSNADSDALGANQIHYIYLDDSAIVTAGVALLTASEFLNDTTAPSWSESKHGWYNGSDRCIGAVLTDGSNNILEFDVFDGRYFKYKTPINELGTTHMDIDDFDSVDLSSCVPKFARMARIMLYLVGTATEAYFDTNDSNVSPEAHYVGTSSRTTFNVPVTSAQVLYYSGKANEQIQIDVQGFFLDRL